MSGARVTVVGAGLGGSLMAITLGRAGHEVALFERRPDPREGVHSGGRSINLAISTRGLHALGQVGLERTILDMSVPMRGRMIHRADGRRTFQPYGTAPHHAIRSVSRTDLSLALLGVAAQERNISLHFEKRCTSVDLEVPSATFACAAGGPPLTVRSQVIVGADGAFSRVRLQMQRNGRFDYQQAFLEHGYKELTIPPAPGGGFALEENALHIWPRGGYMMIALPNLDRSFTCTLFWPFHGPNSFAALRRPAEVLDFFQHRFPDTVPLMPDLVEEYLGHATGSLVTVRCRPWHHEDRAVLIGDACHAVVPFYGQGANAAFEDCVVLGECLARHGTDWEHAFAEFESLRRGHVNILADLALSHFVEMRDRTASRLFLGRKALERGLYRLFPGWFIPLYSMVTFSRIPYGLAVRKARRQWRTVAMVLAAGLLAMMVLMLAMFRARRP
ncbi:MAG: FAD-dependent oxidoreductase [Acidobacteriota bacterium]